MSRAGLLAVLALAWAFPAGAATDADLAAAALRAETRGLSAQLAAQRDDYVRELQEIAGPHVSAEDGAQVRSAYAQSERLTTGHRAASAPLVLKLTLNALRLKTYKETGVLPDTVPEAEEIAAAIMAPWKTGRPDIALPAGDLRSLQRQLLRWQPKTAPRAAELLAAAPVTPAPKPVARAAPRFERDAGTGREFSDPVPGLIADLRSPEPRARALAADELGRRGPGAVSAYGALHAALADPDARVRASAALALGGLGVSDSRLRASLTALLLDKDADVRLSSKTALARLDEGR